MKTIMILILMVFSYTVTAQEVQKDGKTYEVKKDKIFLEGEDVTETLSIADKTFILKQAATITEKLKMQEKAEKELEKAEKQQEKAEKAQKKAEREQKRAEKELKKRKKAQDRFDRANDKLDSALKKYDRLKRKGKLSPQDEAKWLDKIENLREDVAKAKKRL